MTVTRESLSSVIAQLVSPDRTRFGLDTETTGLMEWDSLFSLIIVGDEEYYFDFKETLDKATTLALLRDTFFRRTDMTLFIQNAKFDMRMLAREGIELNCDVHCTHAVERVIRNNYFGKDSYSLASLAKRRGWEKDSKVEEYVQKNKLFTVVEIPGKKKTVKLLHYDRVPLDIMAPYGCMDGKLALNIGVDQLNQLAALEHTRPPKHPTWMDVFENEKRFTKTAYRMERTGIRIDKPFVAKALEYELDLVHQAEKEFKNLTGADFVDANKALQIVFDKMGAEYPLTEKGNPSFAAEVLEEMSNPVADLVNKIRHHDKRAGTYYSSFLFYAGDGDIIHPDVRQAGTETGRCSYRDPNLQNVPKEDEEEDQSKPYHVRESFIPREGHFFYSVDYRQQEFRVMLDYAGEHRLIKEVNEGADVHEATAQLCGITRKQAKTINFGLLYGMGKDKLAKALGISPKEAQELKWLYFGKLPKVEALIRDVITAGETRGYIYNWMGRRNYIAQRDWAYVLPNHMIQGGCADVIKKAMNLIDDQLIAKKAKSKMLLQVHDELLIETPFNEVDIITDIRKVMESIYVPRNGMLLTTSCENSFKNWGYRNKQEGIPDAN